MVVRSPPFLLYNAHARIDARLLSSSLKPEHPAQARLSPRSSDAELPACAENRVGRRNVANQHKGSLTPVSRHFPSPRCTNCVVARRLKTFRSERVDHFEAKALFPTLQMWCPQLVRCGGQTPALVRCVLASPQTLPHIPPKKKKRRI